jgi:hypothetical protein
MSAWLGVVSRSHVERGVRLSIAQVNHGRMTGLNRMSAGDWLVYYSPRTDYPDGDALQAFTAIGRIADHEIFQADDGDFHPFRRRVNYLPLKRAVPLAEVTERLELTAGANWGYQLRRGLLPLSDADFDVIRTAATR